jgi:ectoine hydroxylase
VHAIGAARKRGLLHDDELAQFERDGYLILDAFFSGDRMAELREELAQVVRQRRDDPSEEVVREPTAREVRSIFSIHQTNELFARLAREEKVVRVVRQILGSAVYVHQSRVNLKPGFEGKEFYWHSDFETWHVEDGMPRMRAISCSISLEPNYGYNGPLLVIPGSHQHYVACAGRTPENHYQQSLRKQEYGVPDRDSLAWLVEQGGIASSNGPAGSITFFDCNTMHGSNGNITPYPRSNVFFVYNSVENALVEPFGGQSPRPEFIASRDATPI